MKFIQSDPRIKAAILESYSALTTNARTITSIDNTLGEAVSVLKQGAAPFKPRTLAIKPSLKPRVKVKQFGDKAKIVDNEYPVL